LQARPNPIEEAFQLTAYLRKIVEQLVAGLLRRSKPAPISSNLPNAQITSVPAAMILLNRRLPERALANKSSEH
jgi:hypothetical protein